MILLILLLLIVMVAAGSIAHSLSMSRTKRCMEKERKRYLELIDESYHLAHENEKKYDLRIRAIDESIARADEKLRQNAGLIRNQESMIARQRELEERLADLIMNNNELSGKLRALEDRIISHSRSACPPQQWQGGQSHLHGHDNGGFLEENNSGERFMQPPFQSQSQIDSQSQMRQATYQGRLDADTSLDMGLGGSHSSLSNGRDGFGRDSYQGFSGFETAGAINPLGMLNTMCANQRSQGSGSGGVSLDCEGGGGIQRTAISDGFRNLQEGFEGDMKQTLKQKMISIGADIDDACFILDDQDEPDEFDILSSVRERLNNSAPSSGIGIRDSVDIEGRADSPGQQSKCSKISELSSRGFSAKQISSHLDIPIGEVNIILRLRRHTEKPRNGLLKNGEE